MDKNLCSRYKNAKSCNFWPLSKGRRENFDLPKVLSKSLYGTLWCKMSIKNTIYWDISCHTCLQNSCAKFIYKVCNETLEKNHSYFLLHLQFASNQGSSRKKELQHFNRVNIPIQNLLSIAHRTGEYKTVRL